MLGFRKSRSALGGRVPAGGSATETCPPGSASSPPWVQPKCPNRRSKLLPFGSAPDADQLAEVRAAVRSVNQRRCRRVLPHPRPADRHQAGHRSGPNNASTWRCSPRREPPSGRSRAPAAAPARQRPGEPRLARARRSARQTPDPLGMRRWRAAIARSPERIVITRILSARAFALIQPAIPPDPRPPES